MKLLRGFRFPPRDSQIESWSFEVQIHPGDIRRRVRYLFLSRVQITLACLAVLIYLLFLALAAGLAPGVIGGAMNRQQYDTLAAERAQQGERLQEMVARLERLEGRTQRLHLGLSKLSLAYALPAVSRTVREGQPAEEVLSDSIYSGSIQQGDRLRSRIGKRLAVLETALSDLREFERVHQDRVRTTPSICPLRDDFVLTSSFRNRRSPFTKELEFHAGIDLSAPVGTPIHASADGVVVFAGQYPVSRGPAWSRFGNLVALRHGEEFVTLYGHCAEIRVRAGQKVSRGDVLGTVGNTGWSASPHVHYEIRRKEGDGDFQPLDPLIFILDRRWPNEERLLDRAGNRDRPSGYEPLPSGFAR
ncbi:MAG TPA: M23 family metallopeptidase [Thermoanaerobaculia bacterium]